MELHGKNLIAGAASAKGATAFRATNPATGTELPTAFHEATAQEIDDALRAAEKAFPQFRGLGGKEIAAFLTTIATELEALGDELWQSAQEETGLPAARVQGERGRLLNQVRIFAELAASGSWLAPRIDRADPARRPLPKPDVRAANVPVGPVVVFGASNFPLAISVAGTDTLSALAVGCPVVVKAHPAHPGTSERVGRAIVRAAEISGMPAGVFSMVHGTRHDVGLALVRHPATRAVAFTGSQRGGRALFDAAAARPDPIAVYAEMGSVNPVLALPGALRARGSEIAAAFIQSVTMGVGQFCTNPGLVLAVAGPELDEFIKAVGAGATLVAPATMLTTAIAAAYRTGIAQTERTAGVSVVGRSSADANAARTEAGCAIFTTDAKTFAEKPHLGHEVFGPTSVIVRCQNAAELADVVAKLEGHLVASLHATADDLVAFAGAVSQLETKVGRIVHGGFGTGIEVCAAMNHGGPYPATTDPHFTSIGHTAYLRFVRPLCYQSYPDAALPLALQDRNPLGLSRLVDGRLTTEPLPARE